MRDTEIEFDEYDVDGSFEEGSPFTPTQFPSTSFDESSSSSSFSSSSDSPSFFSSRLSKILIVALLLVMIIVPFLLGPQIVFSSDEENELLAQNEIEARTKHESAHVPETAKLRPPAENSFSEVDSSSSRDASAGSETDSEEASSPEDASRSPPPSLNAAARPSSANGAAANRTKSQQIKFKDTVDTQMNSALRGNTSSALRPLHIGSIGLGHWGSTFLDILFILAFPDRAFLYTQESPTDVVVATHFYGWEAPLPKFKEVPYFSWSGESRLDSLYYFNRPPLFYLLSMVLPEDRKHMEQFANNSQYLVPFVTHVTMDSTFHVDPVLLDRSLALENQPRPYRLAYINSNCEAHRERMFALMLEKCGTNSRAVSNSTVAKKKKKKNSEKFSSHKLCHALGRCSNNLLMAEKSAERSTNQSDAERFHNTILTKFDPDRAHFGANVALFKSYRFALVFEHGNIPGYMTEKMVMAFKGGAIPIFWGSGSDPSYAKQWFNPLAFIDCGDFDSLKHCRDRVYEIDNDPKQLREMQLQPVFKDNTPPDLFKGIDSQFLKEIAMDLRRGVMIQE